MTSSWLWRQLGRYWKCPFLTKLGHNDVTMVVQISTYLKTDIFAFLILKLVCTEILMSLADYVWQILKIPLFAQIGAKWRHNRGRIIKIFKNWLHFWIPLPLYWNFDLFIAYVVGVVVKICVLTIFTHIRVPWRHGVMGSL